MWNDILFSFLVATFNFTRRVASHFIIHTVFTSLSPSLSTTFYKYNVFLVLIISTLLLLALLLWFYIQSSITENPFSFHFQVESFNRERKVITPSLERLFMLTLKLCALFSASLVQTTFSLSNKQTEREREREYAMVCFVTYMEWKCTLIVQ